MEANDISFFQFQVSELMLMFRPEGKYVCIMICMYGYIYIYNITKASREAG